MKIFSKIGLIFFTALLLTPGTLKSLHIFADHYHVYCDHSSEEHIHQKTLDCDILSLQQHSFLTFGQCAPKLYDFQIFGEAITSSYVFLKDHFTEGPALRGPPEVS